MGRDKDRLRRSEGRRRCTRLGSDPGLEVIVTGGSVSSSSSLPTREALVLAAGNGDRFQSGGRQSKLLQPILGDPIIVRTLTTARDAGVRRVEVVVGYQADSLRAVIEAAVPRGLAVHFCFNPDWHLENGVSVLAARGRFTGRFALLMGDHLFEAPVLKRLLAQPAGRGESLLAVDSRAASPRVAAEATKVRMNGSLITAIGKDLTSYDALDTGMFVCAPSVFAAIDAARAAGDTTLSGGIRQLAARRLMRAVDIGNAAWYDIDTMADLQLAESLLAEQAETA